MSIHTEMLLEEYKENLETLNKLKEIVLEKLTEYSKTLKRILNSIEGRVKTEKSLKGKLDLKGDKYKSIFDITDLVGARVVTFYTDEVDLFAAQITSHFDIDWDNSVDKRKMYKVDQFGYMSLHYICRIPKSMFYDEKYPKLNEIRFEVQIRTVLQHVWATIYHDTGYKNDVEVPSEYLRSLNRLAGLLEIADEEFGQIRNGLNDYRKRVKDIVKSGNLADVELNGDSYEAYLNAGGFNKLNKRIATINNMDIEEVSLKSLLPVFRKLGMETLKDLDDLIKNHSDKAYKFAIQYFEETDIDIISTLAGPSMLLFVDTLQKGYGVSGIEQLLKLVYGDRKSNASYAKKVYSIGTKIGIVKE